MRAAILDALRRVPAYSVIGIACILGNNGVVIGAAALGLPWPSAMLLAAAVVLPAGYLLHCRITFGRRATLAGLARYLLAQASGFVLSLAIMGVLREGLHLSVTAAFLATTGVIVLWTFAGTHWAILRREARRGATASPSGSPAKGLVNQSPRW